MNGRDVSRVGKRHGIRIREKRGPFDAHRRRSGEGETGATVATSSTLVPVVAVAGETVRVVTVATSALTVTVTGLEVEAMKLASPP